MPTNYKASDRRDSFLLMNVAAYSQQFVNPGGHVYIKDVFPLWGLMLIVGAMMGTSTWFTTSNQEKPRHQWVRGLWNGVLFVLLSS